MTVIAAVGLLGNFGFQYYNAVVVPHADPRYAVWEAKLSDLDAKIGEAQRWVDDHAATGEDVHWQAENLTLARGWRNLASTELSHENYNDVEKYVYGAHRVLDRILSDPIVFARQPDRNQVLEKPPPLITFSYKVSDPTKVVRARLLIDGIDAIPQEILPGPTAWLPGSTLQPGQHSLRFIVVDSYGWEAPSEWRFTISAQPSKDSSGWPPPCGPSC